jgi:tetratricopeptide (TPR) repeat protein
LTSILLASILLLSWGCSSPNPEDLKQGDAYLEQGQWDNAISAYNAAAKLNPSIKLGPKLAQVYASRAMWNFQNGKLDDAIADFEKASQEDPNIAIGGKLADVYKARANQSFKDGRYSSAVADAEKAIKLNPSDAGAYYTRGSIHLAMGSWDAAITDLNSAIGIDKTIDPDLKLAKAYLQRAVQLLVKGQQAEGNDYLQRIITYSNEALQRNPNSAAAYHTLGSVYVFLQKPDLAMSNLNKAIELDPNDAEAYKWRATAHAQQSNSEAAIADLNKALKIDPRNVQLYSTRGALHNQAENFDLAIDDFTKAIELSPQAALYHFRASAYIGKAAKLQSKQETAQLFEQAIKDWTKAIELDPNIALFYFNRGYAYFETEQWDLATPDLKKVLELSSDAKTKDAAGTLLKEIADKRK